MPVTLVWLRRDLRLRDHPALCAAVERGEAVCVFILDPVMENQYGAAAKWRLGQSLEALSADIAERGGRLVLRRGEALATLRGLIREIGAGAVYWSRLYDSAAIKRDKAVKAALKDDGVDAKSFNGALLHEPWTIETQTGEAYKVYTPFSKACFKVESPPEPLPAPDRLAGGDLASDDLTDWRLEAGMNRGAAVLAKHAKSGEAAAQARLEAFIDGPLSEYRGQRDRFDLKACSGLSPFLAWGEVSPAAPWRAARAKFAAEPSAEQEGTHFLKELLWREFAYHLIYHFPTIETENWRAQWDDFPWRDDNEDAERWCRAMTGFPLVDAALREMYVTGVMHNRGRMLVASLLTKHLLTHWRVGEAWFRECLIDWDPASNAMGWQWTAGSGPDAAPYFRIYNPEGQREKFDPEDRYVTRWLAEFSGSKAPQSALDYFDAAPISWGLQPDAAYPDRMVDLSKGREAALAAYEKVKG